MRCNTHRCAEGVSGGGAAEASLDGITAANNAARTVGGRIRAAAGAGPVALSRCCPGAVPALAGAIRQSPAISCGRPRMARTISQAVLLPGTRRWPLDAPCLYLPRLFKGPHLRIAAVVSAQTILDIREWGSGGNAHHDPAGMTDRRLGLKKAPA